VIAGIPFGCTNSGALPAGLTFDMTTGQLSGTPTESGIYTFKVRVSGTNQPVQEHVYTIAITEAGQVLPPHSTVDAVTYPLDSGTISGLGLYTNGDICTVSAIPQPGYRFTQWKENDTVVSTNATCQFPVALNRSLVASFAPAPIISIKLQPPNTCVLEWPTNTPGILEQGINPASTNWSSVNALLSVAGTHAHVELPVQPGARFFRLRIP